MKNFLFALFLVPALAAAQQPQHIAPFRTAYGDFTVGFKLNGTYGTNGSVPVSNGGGVSWGTLSPAAIAGLTSDAANGINVTNNIHSATLNSDRIYSLLITPSRLPTPAAPVASLGGSGGASLTGACQYVVRFQTASNGSTDASVVSNLVQPSAQMVTLALPNDPTNLAAKWEIFRNSCSNSTGSNVKGLLFWAAEVTYVAGGTSWTDTVTDANLSYTFTPYGQYAEYFNQTATTSLFMPPTVGTPPITWSETNLRPLVGPDILEAYPNSALPRLGSYNLAQFTETFTAGSHGWGNTGQDTANTISVGGLAAAPITMTHWNFTNPGFGPLQNISSAGYSLTPGQAYLFSYFVKAQAPVEQDISQSPSGVQGGGNMWQHGFVDQQVRRKWFYCMAVTSTTVDCGSQTPTTAYGSGTATATVQWFAGGNLNMFFTIPPGAVFSQGDLYVGGMQISAAPTTSYGIVAYGDSETAFDCGNNTDLAGCSSWTSLASGMMNVPIFNRGTGGITCNTLVTNFAATVHPILTANRAAYVLLKCGTNDLSAGTSAATIESYLTSMIGSIVTDGKIPVVATIQPQDKARTIATYEANRQQVNAWIRGNCGKYIAATGPAGGCPYVLDIDKVVQDPLQGNVIRNDPTWQNQTDGTHPQFNERRAEAEYVAQSFVGNLTGHPQIWNFPIPPQYQAVLATTPAADVAATHVLAAGNAGVTDGGAAAPCTAACYQVNQNAAVQPIQGGPTALTSGFVVLVGPYNGSNSQMATFYFANSSSGNWTVGGWFVDTAKQTTNFFCPAVTSVVVPASGCLALYTFKGNGANANLTIANGNGGAVQVTFPAVGANYNVQADLESYNAGCSGATTFLNSFSEYTCTITGAVTLTINNGQYAGQIMTVNMCENATGGFAVSTPASVTNWTAISTTANQCTSQILTWSAGLTKWLSR